MSGTPAKATVPVKFGQGVGPSDQMTLLNEMHAELVRKNAQMKQLQTAHANLQSAHDVLQAAHASSHMVTPLSQTLSGQQTGM